MVHHFIVPKDEIYGLFSHKASQTNSLGSQLTRRKANIKYQIKIRSGRQYRPQCLSCNMRQRFMIMFLNYRKLVEEL